MYLRKDLKLMKVCINEDRTSLLDDFAIDLLTQHYCRKGETVQEAFARASICYSKGDNELAQRLYDYVSKGWFMFASPVLSNAFYEGEIPKGLPISCFLTYVPDSIKGLCEHTTELRWLSVKGGGVGGHWSDVRPIDKKTPGVLGFIHTVDADMTVYKQGDTRRGSYAGYLNIDHPDIEEFIKMRTPTGDINRKSLNLHHGINITDDFLDAVYGDKDWCLVNPHTCEVVKTVKARYLWEEILITRFRTGEPYINYIDEANDKLHPELKKRGLHIKGSNLCNEIHLPTSEDLTAVCCLSSVNLAKYDEWKDTNMVADLVTMLDNVLDVFIKYAPPELQKAVRSATYMRDIGLGAMGFHDYLQDKGVAFESATAVSINRNMFKHIYSEAVKQSIKLGNERGCPSYITDRRNAHLIAIAPNANSSIILGVSPSIEPRASNCYTHKTRVGSRIIKNKYLKKYLHMYGKDTEEVWKSILANKGSVQHLDFLDDKVKAIFKTSFELDQRWVVDMARSRQEFICQGQSVNLFFPAGSDKSYVNVCHLRAFKEDGIGVPLKGLYYLRTESSRQTENVSLQLQRDALKDGVAGSLNECIACHG